jgi:hypothetical protein
VVLGGGDKLIPAKSEGSVTTNGQRQADSGDLSVEGVLGVAALVKPIMALPQAPAEVKTVEPTPIIAMARAMAVKAAAEKTEEKAPAETPKKAWFRD